MDRSLLLIAYYYPPAAVVGALRSARFAKYLPLEGWRPIVLTAQPNHYDVSENTPDLASPPPVSVTRVKVWGRGLGSARTHNNSVNTTAVQGQLSSRPGPAWLRRLNQIAAVPDTRIGWLVPAALHGLRIIYNENPSVLLTTSYPYSAHLIGLVLHALTKTPWIADFRDPWAEYAYLHPNTPLHRQLAASLESHVVAKADAIVANTPGAQARFRARYPSLTGKIHCIPNGYDPDDFAETAPASDSHALTLVHVGSIAADTRRDPESLLLALADFLEHHPEYRTNLKLKFIGHVACPDRLLDRAHTLGLHNQVIVTGYVSHREAVRAMRAADLLVLIHHAGPQNPRIRTTIPAKAYEYLAARRPIFCLTAGGDLASLIESSRAGLCVDPEDPPKVSQALSDLILHRAWWQNRVSTSSAFDEFHGRSLTRALTTILNEIGVRRPVEPISPSPSGDDHDRSKQDAVRTNLG